MRVRACALNHLDLWERRGLRRVTIPLPHISGSDVAGEVVAAGVPSGRDNECPFYEVLEYRHRAGGYAEPVTVPAQNLVPIPDHMDFVSAAAFPLTFVTAWHMLVTKARVKRGEDVLIIAAGSGVGQAAIQVARLHGARVIATAGFDEKLEKARALGAAAVIHHHRQDIAEEIKRMTNTRGVDVVIEHVGEATWAKSIRSLAAVFAKQLSRSHLAAARCRAGAAAVGGIGSVRQNRA